MITSFKRRRERERELIEPKQVNLSAVNKQHETWILITTLQLSALPTPRAGRFSLSPTTSKRLLHRLCLFFKRVNLSWIFMYRPKHQVSSNSWWNRACDIKYWIITVHFIARKSVSNKRVTETQKELYKWLSWFMGKDLVARKTLGFSFRDRY